MFRPPAVLHSLAFFKYFQKHSYEFEFDVFV